MTFLSSVPPFSFRYLIYCICRVAFHPLLPLRLSPVSHPFPPPQVVTNVADVLEVLEGLDVQVDAGHGGKEGQQQQQ